MRYKQINFKSKKINFALFENEYISDFIHDNKIFYEVENLEVLNYLPLQEGAILDIGANIGNHTLYYSKILNRDVYAFEPIKENYDLLKKNLLLNKIENVKVFNFALSMQNSKVLLRQNYPDNSGTWSIVNYNGNIDAKPLDEVDIKEKIAFIKIDVEGHEYEVLKGGVNTIKKNLPIISVEFHSGEKFNQIKDFLERIGYKSILILGRSDNAFFVHSSKMSDIDIPILQNFVEQLISRKSLNKNIAETEIDSNSVLVLNNKNVKKEKRIEFKITKNFKNKLLDKAFLKEIEFEDNNELFENILNKILEKLKEIEGDRLIFNFTNFSNHDFNELKIFENKIYINNEEICDVEDLSVKSISDILRHIIYKFDRFKFYTLVNFNENELKLAHELFELNKIEYGIYVEEIIKLHWEKWSLLSNANLIFSFDEDKINEFKKTYIFNITQFKEFDKLDDRVFEKFEPIIERNENKKKVLIISYYYKPVLSVGIFRPEYWFENLKNLSKGEYETELVSAMRQVEKEKNIHFVPDYGTVTGISTPIDIKLEHEQIKKSVNTVAFSWTKSLIEYFDSHPELSYDYVILTGNPFMHFYFTKYAQEKWNAKVIQDYRDPMGKNPRFYSKDPKITKLNEEMRQKYEDIFCSMSDKVVTVNDYCAKLMSPFSPQPVEIIKNGYNDKVVDNIDTELLEEVKKLYPKIPFNPKKLNIMSLFKKTKKRSPNNRIIRLCYAGSFAHDRKPENLINSIKNVLGYELHHFGNPYPKLEKSSNKRLISHGKKDYAEVIAHLKNMDIGVVYCSHDFESTTKIYDYIACNNIILVITSKENPRPYTLSKELEGLEHVYWVVNDEKEITEFLTKTVFPSNVNRPQRENYSRKASTKKLINLLKRMNNG